MTGIRFGVLVVTGRSVQRDAYGHAGWSYRCETCGAAGATSADNLRRWAAEPCRCRDRVVKGVLVGLGREEEPTGGTLADRTPPPARASVVDEGVEFEPVWFPHRHAASLLGDEAPRPSTITLPPLTLRDLVDRDE